MGQGIACPDVIIGDVEAGAEVDAAADPFGGGVFEYSPLGKAAIEMKLVKPRSRRKQTVSPRDSDAKPGNRIRTETWIQKKTGEKCPGFASEFSRRNLVIDIIYSCLHLMPRPSALEATASVPSSSRKLSAVTRPSDLLLGTITKSLKSLRSGSLYEGPGDTNTCHLVQQPKEEHDSLKEVAALLKKIFVIDEADIDECLCAAKARMAPDIGIHIEVVSATGLRSKNPKDNRSNPYCCIRIKTVGVEEASEEIHRTTVVQSSLEPIWKERFHLKVTSTEDTRLSFEVWHAPQEEQREGLSSKIPFQFSRLVHLMEYRNFIGSHLLDLKILDKGPFQEWLKLTKPKDDDGGSNPDPINHPKSRGKLLVTMFMTTNAALLCPERKSFDRFLTNLVDLKIKENSLGSHAKPWNGTFERIEEEALQAYAKALNLSSSSRTLSWWLVISKKEVDREFCYNCIKNVQKCLNREQFDHHEIQELESSMIDWINCQFECLQQFTDTFPVSSQFLSSHQLTFLIRCFKLLAENWYTQSMLDKVKTLPLNKSIFQATKVHLDTWWLSLVSAYEAKLHNIRTKQERDVFVRPFSMSGRDKEEIIELQEFRLSSCGIYRSFHSPQKSTKQRRQQYSAAGEGCSRFQRNIAYSTIGDTRSFSRAQGLKVKFQSEASCKNPDKLSHLTELADDVLRQIKEYHQYEDIFKNELKISFVMECYGILVEYLASFIKPIVIAAVAERVATSGELASYSGEHPNSSKAVQRRCSRLQEESFYGGSLYRKCYSIARLPKVLCTHVDDSRGPSLFCEFHSWFEKGLHIWLQQVDQRSVVCIRDDIDKDTLQPEEEYQYSSSAIELQRIFYLVIQYWNQLEWPAAPRYGMWPKKIMEVFANLVYFYCQNLCETLLRLLEEKEWNQCKIQICVGMNNALFALENLKTLPQKFQGVDCGFQTCTWPDLSEECQQTIAELEDSVTCLLESFPDRIVKQLTPGLKCAVERSCEPPGNSAIEDFLYNNLGSLKINLNEEYYKRIMLHIWSHVVNFYQSMLIKNKEKIPVQYYNDFAATLQDALHLFSSPEGISIAEEVLTQNEVYRSLHKSLSHLKLSTDDLIAKYYSELYNRCSALQKGTHGSLAVRAYFKRTNLLSVCVIMASDLITEEKKERESSKRFFKGTEMKRSLPNTFVEVSIVPSQWFPGVSTKRTKVFKKSTSPVYDEIIEVVMNRNAHLEKGIILFKVYCQQCCSTNKYIGECILPIEQLGDPLLSRSPVLFTAHKSYTQSTKSKVTLDSAVVSGKCIDWTPPNKILPIQVNDIAPDMKAFEALQSRVSYDKLARKFVKETRSSANL